MGWSCRKDAGDTLTKISDWVVENFDNQNKWTTKKGTYFFESSRTEHDDGAITGSIWKSLPAGTPYRGKTYPDERVTRSGTFRIEGDGTITRFPNLPKEVKAEAQVRP